MRMPNFTGNPKAGVAAILALLLITLWFTCSQRAEAETRMFAGAGEALVSTDPMASGLRFGIEQGPWQVSLVTHGEGAREDDNGNRYLIDPNLGACGTWHATRKRLSIGWGACLFEHGDFAVGTGVEVPDEGGVRLVDDGIQLTGAIALRRVLGERERFYVEWFHVSSAGSSHYNRGVNWFVFGARL